MSEDEIIGSAEVPGWPSIYIIGSFDSRITFFSQQARGFNLAYALKQSGRLKGARQIAVIGAGAAGLSVSAGLALLFPELTVDIFERDENSLHLQRECRRRNLHPHIYDWPRESADNKEADLPYLNWSASSAADVARNVLQQFETLRAHLPNRIEFKSLNEVTKIEPFGSNSYGLSFRNTDTGEADSKAYHAVIIAIGFGAEAGMQGAPFHSYWADQGTPGAPIYADGDTIYLISGSGDGALIDLCAAAIQDFDHTWLIDEVTNWPTIIDLHKVLISIDQEAELHGRGYDFMTAYDLNLKAHLEKSGLIKHMARKLRKRAEIIFNTPRKQPLEQPTATLNRFLAYVVMSAAAQAGKQIKHVSGKLSAAPDQYGTYLVDGANPLQAHKLFIRHGAAKRHAFASFDSIRATYEASHNLWLENAPKRRVPPGIESEAVDAIQAALNKHNIPEPQRESGKSSSPEAGWSLDSALAANQGWLELAFSDRRKATTHLRQPLCPGDMTGAAPPRQRSGLIEQLKNLLDVAGPGFVAVTGTEGNGKSWLVAQTWLSLMQKPLTLFITAESVAPFGTDIRSLLAAKLAEQTGRSGSEAHTSYWAEQILSWAKTKKGPTQGLVVILDGLNQRSKESWAHTIDLLCDELERIGGRLIVSARQHYFNARIRPSLISPIRDVVVPEWTIEERDELLYCRGIEARQLSGSVANSLRNPRLLGIALTLIQDGELDVLKELSVPRLLFEHLTRGQRDGYGESPIEFKRRLGDQAALILTRLKAEQKDDLTIFDGGLEAVVDGRFFVPVAGDASRYTVNEFGLGLALGLAIIDALRTALRNEHDLNEVLSALTEPIAELDETSGPILAALTIACVDDQVQTEIGVAILNAFVVMQNPDEQSFDAFAALVRNKPSVFVLAAEGLALSEYRVANFDWIRFALLQARGDANSWTEIAAAIKNWLGSITVNVEDKIQAFGASADEISEKREALVRELNSKIDDLFTSERVIFNSLQKHQVRSVSALSQLAFELLACVPLASFSDALVRWSLATNLNGGYQAPKNLFNQLICFNQQDWAATRDALLHSLASLRPDSISKVGRWTLVTVLRATGSPEDEESANDLLKVVRSTSPHSGKWRSKERYCLTDPCDPDASKPENVASTALMYAQIDVTKLALTMGAGPEDRPYIDAKPAMARYAPDVAIERQRALAGDVLHRSGQPLRQGIVNLLENASLITEDQARAFASRLTDTETGYKALQSLLDEQEVWTVFHMEIIFPLLESQTQLELLVAQKNVGEVSERLLGMIKPLNASVFLERLVSSLVAKDLNTQAVVLLFSPFNQTALTSEARDILPSLLVSDSVLVRAFAMRMVALSGDERDFRVVLAHAYPHNAGLDWCDRLERRFVSSVMLQAAIIGVDEWKRLAPRIECMHLGEFASKLGAEAAQYVASVIDTLITRGQGLEVDLDSLVIEVHQSEEPELQPPSISLAMREQPPKDVDEAFHRQIGGFDDFDDKQQKLADAYDRVREYLISQDAYDFLDQFSLNDLEAVVAANRAKAGEWSATLLKQSELPRLAAVRAYSAETGHPFRRKLDTHSSANWTPVPGQTGHLGRDGSGSRFGFYS